MVAPLISVHPFTGFMLNTESWWSSCPSVHPKFHFAKERVVVPMPSFIVLWSLESDKKMVVSSRSRQIPSVTEAAFHERRVFLAVSSIFLHFTPFLKSLDYVHHVRVAYIHAKLSPFPPWFSSSKLSVTSLLPGKHMKINGFDVMQYSCDVTLGIWNNWVNSWMSWAKCSGHYESHKSGFLGWVQYVFTCMW